MFYDRRKNEGKLVVNDPRNRGHPPIQDFCYPLTSNKKQVSN
jgi:hypothetical protein